MIRLCNLILLKRRLETLLPLIDRLLAIGVKIIFLGKVLLFKINRLQFYALLCRHAAFYGSNSLVNAIIIELDSIVTFARVREGTRDGLIRPPKRSEKSLKAHVGA